MNEKPTSGESVPYKFTGAERDEETGLYVHGYRSRDEKVIPWLSPDPALERYLPTGNKSRDADLPGLGGVFNSINLNVYQYAGLNPVTLVDPDGNTIMITSGAMLALDLTPEERKARNIDVNAVYVFQQTWLNRKYIPQKLLGLKDCTYLGKVRAVDYPANGMGSGPGTRYEIVDNNGKVVYNDIDDLIREDADFEFYHQAGNFTFDAIMDTAGTVSAVKGATSIKSFLAQFLKGAIKSSPTAVKNIEHDKSLADTVLDSLPFVGTMRDLDSMRKAYDNKLDDVDRRLLKKAPKK